ncbi:MAG: 50S ribosomal protein L32 [Deltaproteobacteria bacterium]|nr:50S ribosomal protein L32 [Deltaproteobacteria bacterium]MBW2305498.1 50S ribosomal protein L32 [Deltaproteobacteria bacterium]
MANPTRRHSRSRRNKRRAHYHLRAPGLSQCSHCGEPKLPHRVCPECGRYRDLAVMEPRE